MDGPHVRGMRAMNLADALVERGHRVTIWSTDFHHQEKRHRYGRDERVTVSESQLQEIERHAASEGVTVATRQVRGHEAALEILRAAGDVGAKLIVMGAYGHTRIRELILGSTTSMVLQRATVPVLLVRG